MAHSKREKESPPLSVNLSISGAHQGRPAASPLACPLLSWARSTTLAPDAPMQPRLPHEDGKRARQGGLTASRLRAAQPHPAEPTPPSMLGTSDKGYCP